jgi:uncharacterized coiled-coil protein SlyX
MAQQTDHIGEVNKMVEHHIVDSNKMITAVSWLVEKIKEDYPEIAWAYKKECQQAKAMEKEQITQAHLFGLLRPIEIEATKQSEQYYNETYNK